MTIGRRRYLAVAAAVMFALLCGSYLADRAYSVAPASQPVEQLASPMRAQGEPLRAGTLAAELETARVRLAHEGAEFALADMLRAIEDHDDASLNVARQRLVSLGKQGDTRALSVLLKAAGQVPDAWKPYLLSIIGEFGTEAALEELLACVQGPLGQRQSARVALLNAISRFGQHAGNAMLRQTFSSRLQAALARHAGDDGALTAALAKGLSRLGTRSGVETVLQLLDGYERQGQVNQPVSTAMAKSLLLVHRRPGLAVLASRLQQDPGLTRNTTRLAGNALAAAGNAKATANLLRWAAHITDKSLAETSVAWLAQVRDETSLDMLRDVKRFGFRDQSLQAEISRLARRIEAENRPELAILPAGG